LRFVAVPRVLDLDPGASVVRSLGGFADDTLQFKVAYLAKEIAALLDVIDVQHPFVGPPQATFQQAPIDPDE
jgi:hypothetical protein